MQPARQPVNAYTQASQGRMMHADEAVAYAIQSRRQPLSADSRTNPVGAAAAANRAPWLDMPAGAYSFSQSNAAAVALPAIGVEVTVVTFQVPQGMNGVIQKIANQYIGGGWTEGTGDLVWRIEADGVSIRNYNNILGTLGTSAAPGDRTANPIRVYENQTIALIARNVNIGVAGSPLLGLLSGYFYPLTAEDSNTWY
jgi:hypothetical protein